MGSIADKHSTASDNIHQDEVGLNAIDNKQQQDMSVATDTQHEDVKQFVPQEPIKIAYEDQMRAEVYGFIAKLLLATPNQGRLEQLSQLEGDDTPLGEAFALFAKLAGNSNETDARDEYNALFIGLGRGELLPYASYYLTGFLNEKPLAKLRSTMKEHGIVRRDDVKEPEDHIGSLMEMMAGLIVGELGIKATAEGELVAADLKAQQAFFNAHIAPWAAYFFQDLERAKGAKLYQPLGTIGRLFVEIESNAFDMM
jgi:TorA maturation chaperone TorD